MYENDIDYMTSAFRTLYEIETILKYTIQSTYFRIYGSNWERYMATKKPIDRMLYHEVVNLFKFKECLGDYFTNDELVSLGRLSFIRNDIAHMRVITPVEYELLQECHHFVLRSKKQRVASS